MNYKFDLDLRDGQWAEELVSDILSGAKTVEVKRDFLNRETGYVFIETHQNGRPSGILTTEADYWAFVVMNNRVLFVPTEHLRRMLPFGIPAKGGDGGRFDGVLLPLIRLARQFIST